MHERQSVPDCLPMKDTLSSDRTDTSVSQGSCYYRATISVYLNRAKLKSKSKVQKPQNISYTIWPYNTYCFNRRLLGHFTGKGHFTRNM